MSRNKSISESFNFNSITVLLLLQYLLEIVLSTRDTQKTVSVLKKLTP